MARRHGATGLTSAYSSALSVGGEEVAEEDAVLQHGLAHLDEAQALGSRNPPFAAEAQHLAARPGARLR